MKKIFKKSILILLGFILGSIACISIGVYAYSYAATDIQYSGSTSVKQAIDDLYTKAANLSDFQIGKKFLLYTTNTNSPLKGDSCNSASAGCACYYIYNYVSGAYDTSSSTFQEPSTVGSTFNYGSHTGCSFASYGCSYSEFDSEWAESDASEFTTNSCKRMMWSDAYGWGYMGTQNHLQYRCEGTVTCTT